MTAPLRSAPSSLEPPPPVGLASRVPRLVERYARLWRETSAGALTLGPEVAWRRRLANGRASRRMIDELASEVERCPQPGPRRDSWQREVQDRVRRFGELRLGWPAGYRRLLVGDEFFATSRDFVRRAREFDPEIEWADVGQALRNVWIVNSLQMLMGERVELTPSAFAYSMLYPYTDNLLDDPTVDAEDKRQFNHALGRRLAGAPEVAGRPRQRAVWRLIRQIETQYPRAAHPGVYESLLAIHGGQVRSLEQHGGGPRDLLEISLTKGGASVLADGYLVRGRLSPPEEDFCFGYGVFLQLLDDLQDARPDVVAGHQTLFSEGLDRGPLDDLTSRLHHYMRRVLEESEAFAGPTYAERRDLILRNCTFLLVGAVAEAPELFSRGFRRGLERQWPLGLRSMRRLRRRATERFRRAAKNLRQRHGDDLEALIGDAEAGGASPQGSVTKT